MKRTTVMLPLDLKDKVNRYLHKAHLSFGEFVRQLLEERMKNAEGKSPHDSFFGDQAIYTAAAPSDLAKNHDDYLYGEKN